MYNTTTRSYTMEDTSGSYDWMIENYEPADMKDMSDADIYAWIDPFISQSKEEEIRGLDDEAEAKSYPCFGYTTAQIFENADEYIAFKKQEIETDLNAEREPLFNFIKNWLASE